MENDFEISHIHELIVFSKLQIIQEGEILTYTHTQMQMGSSRSLEWWAQKRFQPQCQQTQCQQMSRQLDDEGIDWP